MAVTTTVGRWGNAMALRIPQALCDEMNLNVGDALEVSVEAGVLEPAGDDYALRVPREQQDPAEKDERRDPRAFEQIGFYPEEGGQV